MTSNKRTAIKGIGAGAAALLGGVGTAAAKPPSRGDTIVDVAVGAEDECNVLVGAVQEAGLAGALSGNRQLTVFAPTDEAFGALGVTPDNVRDVDFEAAVGASLAEMLTYHVSPGRRDAESVTTSDGLPTLNGAKIDADGTTLNEETEIIDTNIPASNGFVHVIDGVLLP